ncbi:hypothetical protein ACHAWF_010861 [Thalassiosira exigua]
MPRLSFPTVRLLPSLAALLALARLASAARSLSARRVRGAPTARSADRYDRSVTTFSPEGRLLQLEYAQVAAEERGRGLTACVEYDGTVVFAFPSGGPDDDGGDGAGVGGASEQRRRQGLVPSSPSPASMESRPNQTDEGTKEKNMDDPASFSAFASNIEHDPSHNTKVHRLSPTHLLLTSGLAGDSRTLASAFRRLASSWVHMQYGEVVTARELAIEMGRVRHSIGLRPGARVLGVIGMLIGLDDAGDDDDDGGNGPGVEVRMYRSLPGGTVDRCNVCCTGGGADASGNAARKEAMEALLGVVSPHEGEEISSTKDKLQRIIEEVGHVALKYHPDSQADEGGSEDTPHDGQAHQRQTVDIWVVRAVPADISARNERNRAFVSPHRYLGKALMETTYARRVAVDQLSDAAQALVRSGIL